MKQVKLLCYALVLGIAFTACNKEKKLQKRLTKKEGTWNITTYTNQYISDGIPYDPKIVNNAGTVEFKDEENGIMNLQLYLDSPKTTYPFTWSNTETTVTLYSDVHSNRTELADTMKFTVQTNEKKEQVWTRAIEYYDASSRDSIRETYRFDLQRAD